MVENTDPIVFYLYNAFNSEEVRQLLIDKFRSSGHCRRIDFIDWDCLNEKPPRGGDLYIFDSVVLSHMLSAELRTPLYSPLVCLSQRLLLRKSFSFWCTFVGGRQSKNGSSQQAGNADEFVCRSCEKNGFFVTKLRLPHITM